MSSFYVRVVYLEVIIYCGSSFLYYFWFMYDVFVNFRIIRHYDLLQFGLFFCVRVNTRAPYDWFYRLLFHMNFDVHKKGGWKMIYEFVHWGCYVLSKIISDELIKIKDLCIFAVCCLNIAVFIIESIPKNLSKDCPIVRLVTHFPIYLQSVVWLDCDIYFNSCIFGEFAFLLVKFQ